jgi:selenocysteine lyase/cysteine desulfurase
VVSAATGMYNVCSTVLQHFVNFLKTSQTGDVMPLDLTLIRAQFPALNRPAIFFDNPGGTQIAQPAIDRMNTYLVEHNANHDGAFQTSRESDAVLEKAHSALADFFQC